MTPLPLRRAAAILLVLLPILAVYRQVGGHSFVNWDDDKCVYANPVVKRGLTLEGAAWGFRTGLDAGFIPLTWISRMADVSLFGLSAGWHHRENVLFHAVNTVLLLLLLHAMTGALWRSALVAALFALHPLHVESVAWVTERKDVLSTMFWLLTTLSYVRYARKPGARRYAAVAGFFALGLMSKPMLVTLPFTLLLLDWWPLGRLSPERAAGGSPGSPFRSRVLRLAVEKAPLFAMSAAAAAATYALVAPTGTMALWEEYGLGLRLSNAIVSYASYLGKMVWPFALGAVYPYPVRTGIAVWKIVLAVLLLGAASCIAAINRKRRPWLAAGWVWYLGTLLPVIGIIHVGPQAMADRYSYVPLTGILLLATWEAAEWRARLRVPRAVAASAAAAAVAVLATASWVQAGYWKDGVTLFGHTVAVTENNWLAHNNLGTALIDRGRVDEAIANYRAALRIRPNYAAAHNNLGNALGRIGRLDEAAPHLREALRIYPEYSEAHTNLGNVLAMQGSYDEAIAHYREAIRMKPAYAEAHSNLGTALWIRGSREEAIASYREALRLEPNHAAAHNNLGVALVGLGRSDEAVAHFREAIRISPGFADATRNLQDTLAAAGRRPAGP